MSVCGSVHKDCKYIQTGLIQLGPSNLVHILTIHAVLHISAGGPYPAPMRTSRLLYCRVCISSVKWWNWKQKQWQHSEECMCRLRNIALESVTEKCDRRTDGRTDRQTTNKVIPMCLYASQATQKLSLVNKRPKGPLLLTWLQVLLFNVRFLSYSATMIAIEIGPKNTNLAEDIEILLPVKFCWILFSDFKGEVENVLANQRLRGPSFFFD